MQENQKGEKKFPLWFGRLSFAKLYQILSREPKKHCNFDTMCIRVAVLFLALFRII